MTTCNDIVRLALNRLRQISSGETPQGVEAADAMTALQGLYDQWSADGLFGRVNDVIATANYIAREQDRVINDGGFVITLPLTITPSTYTTSQNWPNSGAYDYGRYFVSSPRPPLDLAMVQVLSSNTLTRSIYDAQQRLWVTMNNLQLTDNAPLASRGAVGLSSCLAEVIADDYGTQASASTVRQSTMFRWGLSSRYESQRVTGCQDYF